MYGLNVGDKVRIRKDLKIGKSYGVNGCKDSVTLDMKERCGSIVTIFSKTLNGKYKIKEDNGNYFWTKEMFEESNDIELYRNEK